MKNLFPVLFILIIGACQTKVEVNQTKENTAIAKGMFDAFNAHDWEKMASYYSDDAMFLDPSFGQEYIHQSREEIAAKYKEMETMFPDIRDDVQGIYPSGDKVFVEFISSGTSPDGTTFTLPIACVLTIQNGKIVKDATYYDNSQE